MNPDEKILLERAKKGDIDAFETLVEDYQKKVYNIALRMIGNSHDAEELAQEVFIRVFKSLRNFKEQAQFSTWIYRITTNLCLDELRKRKNRKVVYLDQEIDTGENEVKRQLEDEGPTPDVTAEKNEVRELVLDAIQKLPDNHRTMLILRDLNGMSYDDIAKILNSPEGTVKSRINRARQALKNLLKNNKELFDNYFVK